MHELSIAMSILDVALEASARQGDAPVLAVHLKLGPLSGVVKEALLASFGKACDGTTLAGCELVIEEIPITMDCPICRQRRAVVSMQEMCCCDCGAPAQSIASGRELEVAAIEIAS